MPDFAVGHQFFAIWQDFLNLGRLVPRHMRPSLLRPQIKHVTRDLFRAVRRDRRAILGLFGWRTELSCSFLKVPDFSESPTGCEFGAALRSATYAETRKRARR